MKNAVVACLTAKKKNPRCDVAFATNLSESELPKDFIQLLSDNEIHIFYIEYDCFQFPKDYRWSLAFYKLCVLCHIAKMNYQAICYLDTDVFIQGSFDSIWDECEQNILLYDINHGLNVENYRIFVDEIQQFSGKQRYLTHYGGEFFAATTENAKKFVNECQLIYSEMIEKRFMTTRGDEFILSVAADRLRTKVKNAGAYIYRFWTGADFRLISTCYQFNRVTIIHVPNEKELGMLRIYDRYCKHGVIPSDEQAWIILRLTNIQFYYKVRKTIKNIIKQKDGK